MCQNCARQVVSFNQDCILFNNGSLACLGSNENGQLGRGTTSTDEPFFALATVVSGTPIRSAGTGEQFTCVLADSPQTNKVLCFGYGGGGELGDGRTYAASPLDPASRSLAAVEVQNLKQSSQRLTTPRITQLVVGQDSACVLYESSAGAWDAAVQCWGANYGLSATNVAGTGDAAAIAMSISGKGACMLTKQGTVFCWSNAISFTTPLPQIVGGMSSVVHISYGGYETAQNVPAPVGCGIVRPQGEKGSVWCWGLDQRFKGLLSNSAAPWQVQGLPDGNAIDVVVGAAHACALVDVRGGEVYCWGANHLGQLGQGYSNGTWADIKGSAVPLKVKGLDGVSVISLFGRTPTSTLTCAKASSQRVLCWGAAFFSFQDPIGTWYAASPLSGLCA